jgi:protein-S-isoprenylcysteine O-methyltransferase Ste14
VDSGILKVVLFAVISGWLLYVSRRSLRVARSHGFYRFFAWEAILALILINSGAWFSDPLSILQIVSWVFLLVSLDLLGQGLYLIRVAGKPSSKRQDGILLSFEKTSTLVTSGIYRYVRHPLYGSLLFLAWGTFLKEITWYSVCLVVVATLCLVATAKADEAECVRYFGSSYEEYITQTKMFVPLLF